MTTCQTLRNKASSHAVSLHLTAHASTELSRDLATLYGGPPFKVSRLK